MNGVPPAHTQPCAISKSPRMTRPRGRHVWRPYGAFATARDKPMFRGYPFASRPFLFPVPCSLFPPGRTRGAPMVASR